VYTAGQALIWDSLGGLDAQPTSGGRANNTVYCDTSTTLELTNGCLGGRAKLTIQFETRRISRVELPELGLHCEYRRTRGAS